MSKQAKRERQRQRREARRAYEARLRRRRRLLRALRITAIILVPVVAVGVYFLVTGGDDDSQASPAVRAGCREAKAPPPKPSDETTYTEPPPMTIDPASTYTALVDTSCGSFTIQLDPAAAPQTVNSFVFLANEGFYDGLTFHRVVRDFVVQGGDPKGDGTGGPGYTLPDEPPPNGYQRGSVAMANSGPNTTGSQFFVVTTDEGAANLGGPPYAYSILGQVTEGIDTIERINRLGSRAADPSRQQPRAPVVIDKITITETPPTPAT